MFEIIRKKQLCHLASTVRACMLKHAWVHRHLSIASMSTLNLILITAKIVFCKVDGTNCMSSLPMCNFQMLGQRYEAQLVASHPLTLLIQSVHLDNKRSLLPEVFFPHLFLSFITSSASPNCSLNALTKGATPQASHSLS